MARRTTYIIVEGPHDSSVVGAVLRRNGLGLSPVSRLNDVDEFWKEVIPRTFPPIASDGEPQFGRVRVPDFYQTENHSVAIQTAGGLTQLVTTLNDDLQQLSQLPDAIGFIIDTDNEDANAAFTGIIKKVSALKVALKFSEQSGKTLEGPPRTGVFVLPNNIDAGTLEDTMLECAGSAYPQLLPVAESAVETVTAALKANADWLPKKERTDFEKPFGPNKSRIGVIGAILKPTYAIGNTYRQHNWITDETLKLPKLSQLSTFLTELLS